jgi:hypothetical protein
MPGAIALLIHGSKTARLLSLNQVARDLFMIRRTTTAFH